MVDRRLGVTATVAGRMVVGPMAEPVSRFKHMGGGIARLLSRLSRPNTPYFQEDADAVAEEALYIAEELAADNERLATEDELAVRELAAGLAAKTLADARKRDLAWRTHVDRRYKNLLVALALAYCILSGGVVAGGYFLSTVSDNDRQNAIAARLELCETSEALKAAQRETAQLRFERLDATLRLLKLEKTPEIEDAARRDYSEALARFAPAPVSCAEFARNPDIEIPPG